jgi:hypothetical protein
VTAARRLPEWLERMREMSVSAVAAELGRSVAPPRGASGGHVYGCPACSADRRHTKAGDKRGAIGIAQNGRGWRCFQCDAAGDAIDFVACALRGRKLSDLGDAGKAEVRDWCQRWLRLDGSGVHRRPAPSPPPPEPRREPVYPPADEVEALWSACVPVCDVPEVRAWLDSKRIDAISISDADMARALPSSASLPRWARTREGSWLASNHRLVVPMVDASGVVRSLRARRLSPGDPKSVAAGLYHCAGLVLACGLARQVLAYGKAPEWWEGPLRFEVAEGEKKWLLRMFCYSDANERAPAFIGVESGSWTAQLAARIPDGSEIFIATDPDETGARYATAIVQTFSERIRARTISIELRDEHEIDVAPGGQYKVRVSR